LAFLTEVAEQGSKVRSRMVPTVVNIDVGLKKKNNKKTFIPAGIGLSRKDR
jgi:hypothetical protein